MDLSTSPFNSVHFCFVYFEALLLVHTYLGLLCLFGKLTILSICSASVLLNFLKSPLSDINIVTLALSGICVISLHPFPLNLPILLY